MTAKATQRPERPSAQGKPNATDAKSPAATAAAAKKAARQATKLRRDIAKATGCRDPIAGARMMSLAYNALLEAPGTNRTMALGGLVSSLKAFEPRDELEGMLAAQMLSAHSMAMECMARAMRETTIPARDLHLKHAEKLMATYARHIEALDKHRGKGRQKITVEHVHVHAGGQAIVGNVSGKEKAKKSAPQARVAALSDRSDEGIEVLAPRTEKDAARVRRDD